jgi:TPR repeat protein
VNGDLASSATFQGRAAAQNFTAALYEAPLCVANGDGVSIDLKSAAKYYKLSADQNLAVAQYNYALCLTNGDGVSVDLKSAAKYYKLSADQNVAVAQYNYALCLMSGRGVSIDLISAAKYYKLSADQNHAVAQNNYAWCLEHGWGVSIDLVSAAKYYKLSADQNHAVAQFNYALCLLNGRGVSIDLKSAAKYHKLSADQNYAAAQVLRGSLLAKGRGAAPSPVFAVRCYEAAAQLGDGLGWARLGFCLELGHGIERNLIRAVDCYRLSAAEGDPSGQANLGFCLEHGIGIDQDVAQCLACYQKAADQNHRQAAFQCALSRHFGIGVDVDLEAAETYYARPRISKLISHSFRCLRSLNKARAPPSPRSRAPNNTPTTPNILISPPAPGDPSLSGYLTAPVEADNAFFIGAGGFSSVTLARDPKTQKTIAVKHLRGCGPQDWVIREVERLVQLKHPCVVPIVGWSPPQGSTEAQIQMEFAEHRSLYDVLEKVKSGAIPHFWDPTRIGIIICGIVLGMRFVHSRGIIHRDLKPSNILLNGRGHPWIADFGTSRAASADHTWTEETGTVHYAAPELFQDGVDCTAKCDVFSFGLVLYEILTRMPVFSRSERPFEVIRRLRARDLPAIPARCGRLMQALIPQCLREEPEDRPSFEQIFARFEQHHFGVVPEADSGAISDFCRQVLAWEASQSSIVAG